MRGPIHMGNKKTVNNYMLLYAPFNILKHMHYINYNVGNIMLQIKIIHTNIRWKKNLE